MRIFVTGTRGIPDIPGGVEKHCEALYPLIAAMGHEVILATRTPYVKDRRKEWKGVRLVHIYAPRIKSLEAIVHTTLAVLKARFSKPDIVHIHAIGPSIVVPLAKLLGLTVVVTNHGPDYDRQKWGKLAKFMLRLGEYLGGRFADEVIVISHLIANIIKKRCNRSSNIIYNGVEIPGPTKSTDCLAAKGIVPGRYILAVCRFVPEKGLHLLVEAFKKLDGDYQLVIAGDADHETEYSRDLKKQLASDKRIIPTGYISGEPLNQIFSHARLFVLPSYHEGLPIALLEAMAYGIPVLVSDIPANLEVNLPPERYFRCGDVESLKEKLKKLIQYDYSTQEKKAIQEIISNKYNWQKIAEQTVNVYNKLIRK
ncbi:glycosyltransferase family 4 protein [Desulfovulcanus sp.]